MLAPHSQDSGLVLALPLEHQALPLSERRSYVSVCFLAFFGPEFFPSLFAFRTCSFCSRMCGVFPPGMGPVLCEPKLGPGCWETVSVALSVRVPPTEWDWGLSSCLPQITIPLLQICISLTHFNFSSFPEMLQLQGVGEMATWIPEKFTPLG